MTHPRVLVVEDEENLLRLISAYLQREGFDIVTAADGEEALTVFADTSPDLVILDVMLPLMDGWEVCRRIRATAETPIIILTARGEELDRIHGLELGADDYVTKPFSPKELVLRVHAVLRRTGDHDAIDDEQLRYPGLDIDRSRRHCIVAGKQVELTRREFDLLWHMARDPGRAFERGQLLQQVWGYDYIGDARTIDVHITRLREKLEGKAHSTGSTYRYLHTVWGIGYKFDVVEVSDTES